MMDEMDYPALVTLGEVSEDALMMNPEPHRGRAVGSCQGRCHEGRYTEGGSLALSDLAVMSQASWRLSGHSIVLLPEACKMEVEPRSLRG